MSYVTVSLDRYLRSAELRASGHAVFDQMVANFTTAGRNLDVEWFIKHKAKQYQNMGWATTYLVLNLSIPELCGFFTLTSLGITIYGNEWTNMSVSQRKKISPFGYRQMTDQKVPGYLLGQIGRNYAAKEPISGKILLSLACAKVEQANKIATGRYLYLEANPVNKLMDFYRSNDFTYWKYADGSLHRTQNNQVVFLKKLNH